MLEVCSKSQVRSDAIAPLWPTVCADDVTKKAILFNRVRLQGPTDRSTVPSSTFAETLSSRLDETEMDFSFQWLERCGSGVLSGQFCTIRPHQFFRN